MSRVIFSTIFGVMCLGAGMLCANDLPELVYVPIQKAYVPVGFDNNDRIQVTVEGVFPNTCYRVGTSSFKFDEARSQVQLIQSAYKYRGDCLNIPVSFTETINVGLIPAGNFSVVDLTSHNTIGGLQVGRSNTSMADDYLYLSVTDAFITQNYEDNSVMLTIRGTMADRCTKVGKINVQYFPDSIVVQPIAVHDNTGTNPCAQSDRSFERRILLPSGLFGKFLLHVRSMNGQAVNKIVSLGRMN